jgi:hypothetical protein
VPRTIFVAAAGIHLVIAALFSTHVPVEKYIPAAVERPLRIYGSYTGAHTRFNFFAPTVPSQARVHFVLVNAQGMAREVALSTASADANQRLATMFGSYEMAHLRPFLVRAWAAYVASIHPDAQSIEVRVEILDLPTLAEAKAGKMASWVEVEKTKFRRDEVS